MPIHAQELSSFGFEGFYVELGKELMECRTLAEKYPASELMVKKGTRMQELQKMNDEALVKEALHLYSAWQQPAGRGYVCVCVSDVWVFVCVCVPVCLCRVLVPSAVECSGWLCGVLGVVAWQPVISLWAYTCMCCINVACHQHGCGGVLLHGGHVGVYACMGAVVHQCSSTVSIGK